MSAKPGTQWDGKRLKNWYPQLAPNLPLFTGHSPVTEQVAFQEVCSFSKTHLHAKIYQKFLWDFFSSVVCLTFGLSLAKFPTWVINNTPTFEYLFIQVYWGMEYYFRYYSSLKFFLACLHMYWCFSQMSIIHILYYATHLMNS